ncbi:MAG: lysophospholipase [Candidatus Dormibacteria bacterium]
MRELERRSPGARGLSLFWRLWLPDEASTRGRVLLAHGYAEHGGRYLHTGERLTRAGWEVVVPDHRGHGRSQGRPVSVVRFDDYVEDLHAIAAEVAAERGNAPTVLLGHSMGGLIAAVYALRHAGELRGLVLSAPAVLPGRVSAISVGAGRLLARVTPELGVLRLPLDKISRDPAVVAAYRADPLVHARPVRARLGAEMLRAMDEVGAGLPAWTLPILVMQGSADRLVDPGAAGYVHSRVGSRDRTLRVYPGLYHEILNEPEREQVLDDLLDWLDRLVPVTTAVGG